MLFDRARDVIIGILCYNKNSKNKKAVKTVEKIIKV